MPHWPAGVHDKEVSVLLQHTSLTVLGIRPMKHAVKSAASNNRLSLVLSNFGNLGSTQGSAVQSVQADAHLYSLDYATQWYCCASSNGSGRFDVTACAGGAAATTADAPDRNALQLQLQELSLDNVDALEALKLNIQVSSALFHTSLALCVCIKPESDEHVAKHLISGHLQQAG